MMPSVIGLGLLNPPVLRHGGFQARREVTWPVGWSVRVGGRVWGKGARQGLLGWGWFTQGSLAHLTQ